ncbi:MAG: hypothetical protein PWR09_1128, partial [Archaeoglobi archaeon]|nr:hypothetical protein [Archaeoglobi archaeon]
MRENLRELLIYLFFTACLAVGIIIGANETLFNVFDRFVDAVYLLALTFLLVANV